MTDKTLEDWARTYQTTHTALRPCLCCGQKGGIDKDVASNARGHRCSFTCGRCGARFHSDWRNGKLVGVGLTEPAPERGAL